MTQRRIWIVRLGGALAAVTVALAGASAGAQPAAGPGAPDNLRCPGPSPSYDPATQQVVLAWQSLVAYPRSSDDQGPRGVALDRACNLYVADSEFHRVVKISPRGDVVAQWGADGRGPGQFHRPGALAVDADGAIYVADSGNDRVQKLSPSGQSLAVWQTCSPGSNPCSPTPGYGPGQFFDPEGIAVDGQGNVYVSDSGNNRLQKLDRAGKSLAVFGGQQGAAPGQFNAPFGVALDQDGNVYVADLNNHRVQKLSPAGQPLASFGGGPGAAPGQLTQPRGVAVDGSGNVYVADTQNHRVERFGPDGAFQTQWRRCEDGDPPCQFPNSGGGLGEFFYPRGLAADAAGDLYAADTANNRVQRLIQTVVALPTTPAPDDLPPADVDGQ